MTGEAETRKTLAMLQGQIRKNGILDYNGSEETITLTLTKRQWDRIGEELESKDDETRLKDIVEKVEDKLVGMKERVEFAKEGSITAFDEGWVSGLEWLLAILTPKKPQLTEEEREK